MNRQEAIEMLQGYATGYAYEHCSNREEVNGVKEEAREALRALGVKDEELSFESKWK